MRRVLAAVALAAVVSTGCLIDDDGVLVVLNGLWFFDDGDGHTYIGIAQKMNFTGFLEFKIEDNKNIMVNSTEIDGKIHGQYNCDTQRGKIVLEDHTNDRRYEISGSDVDCNLIADASSNRLPEKVRKQLSKLKK